jgi:mycofactocin biosynthetic radical S-adenosylmethionine protein MftC
MDHLRDAGFGPFKISVVCTRHNVDQLDEFKALADSYGAQLRITRLRPSGRGADTWHDLHLTNAQQRQVYHWLLAHGRRAHRRLVLPPQRARAADRCPGLNLCGAGRVVCLIDPIGDVYACPFVIHDEFKAGNVRDPGGFAPCGGSRPVHRAARATSRRRLRRRAAYDACQGGCMAAKFFTGLPARRPRPRVRPRPRRHGSPSSTGGGSAAVTPAPLGSSRRRGAGHLERSPAVALEDLVGVDDHHTVELETLHGLRAEQRHVVVPSSCTWSTVTSPLSDQSRGDRFVQLGRGDHTGEPVAVL